ncbi:hypothetical protein [Escherichia coli]|uniref:hypothetical protein n=1 Tax=Escherichia coli TaxID=562 RepID=UPI0010CC8122|nr:hypothetical protein [Escherichia coli]HDV7651521.1 hypothetical protein [Escherichia coli]HEO1181610.1 hypothetical protein [Escherichia coli]
MPALVLWSPALSLVLTKFPFIFLLTFFCQSIGCAPSLINRHSIRIASNWLLSYSVVVDTRFSVNLHWLSNIQQDSKRSIPCK